MARCGCEGLTCACLVKAGTGATVTGTGTASNPYVVSATRGQLRVVDTPTVDLTLTGDGTTQQPYFLSADVTAHLSDLSDVSLPGAPQNGYVLSWNGSQWVAAPPSTAPVGAVNVAGCLTGDGSAANPVTPTIDPAGGLVCNPQGLGAGPSLRPPVLQPWNHQWRAEFHQMLYGAGALLAEFARWGQWCFIRFGWQGGAGFNGGTGRYFWTLPFTAAPPSWQHIPAHLRLSNGQECPGEAILTPGTTQLRLTVPQNFNTSLRFAMRNSQEPYTNGTGFPAIAGTDPLSSSPNSLIGFAGWYRIADGA